MSGGYGEGGREGGKERVSGERNYQMGCVRTREGEGIHS